MSTLNITELLPKKIIVRNIGEVKRVLNQISFISNVAQEALKAFNGRLFESFDALGGDTSCHIRALFVVVFAKKTGIKEELAGIIEKIEVLMKQIKGKLENIEDFDKEKPLSCDEFLKKMNLQFELNFDLFFLVRSFILTKAKDVDSTGREEENPELLNCFVPEKNSITKSFKKDFVMKAQRELCGQSVEFLRNLVKDKMLDIEAKDKFERRCVSCFCGIKDMVNFLKEKKEPILIRVFNQNPDKIVDKKKAITLLFKSDDGLHFQRAEKGEGALFVIEGFCKEMDRGKIIGGFKEHGLETIILANAAQHPQFFNRDQPEYASALKELENNEEFLKFKALSSTIGCSIDMPTLFCIDHIFASSFESLGAIGEL